MAKDSSLLSLIVGWPKVLGYAFLGALAGFAISFVMPLEYSSSVRLLITQPNSITVDAYTVLKSNERIAQNISQLLYTSTFLDKIVNKANELDYSKIPQSEYEKRKYWARAVRTSVEAGSGLLTITVYDTSAKQARSLVSATSKEVAEQTKDLFGDFIKVTEIDTPIDSRWFARPNFLVNALYGALIGAFLTIAWLLLRR